MDVINQVDGVPLPCLERCWISNSTLNAQASLYRGNVIKLCFFVIGFVDAAVHFPL